MMKRLALLTTAALAGSALVFLPNNALEQYAAGASNTCLIVHGQAKPVPNGDGTYVIDDVKNLVYLSENFEDTSPGSKSWLDEDFVQTASIDLQGCVFTPIGKNAKSFTGTFDGSGETITGLTVVGNAGRNDFIGLFGQTDGATLRDIHLVDVSLAGTIAGEGVELGPIVGGMRSGSLVGSSVSGDVDLDGNADVGGMVGYLKEGTIEDSRVEGRLIVEASRGRAGGMIGAAEGDLTRIFNSHVVGSEGSRIYAGTLGDAGGFSGHVFEGEFVGVSVSGVLEVAAADWAAGGLSGSIYTDAEVSASTVGSGVIVVGESETNGDNNNPVGGFVGYSDQADIANSYTFANVSGRNTVGGFIGWNDLGTTIKNSYAAGSVAGTGVTGGFAGDNRHVIANSFWDMEASGIQAQGDGIGRNTADMTSLATFSAANWSITSASAFGFDRTADEIIWGIGSGLNCGYPFLYWQTESAATCSEDNTDGPSPDTSEPTAPQVTSSQPASSPSIHLDVQGALGAGTPVLLEGRNLKPGSTYSLVMRSTPTTVTTGTVPRGGRLSQAVSLPAAIDPGTHTLTLRATGLNGSTLTLATTFVVSSSGSLTSISPGVGSVVGVAPNNGLQDTPSPDALPEGDNPSAMGEEESGASVVDGGESDASSSTASPSGAGGSGGLWTIALIGLGLVGLAGATAVLLLLRGRLP